MYVLAKQYNGLLTKKQFSAESFGPKCDVSLSKKGLLEFRYFMQKAFIEAHAVAPKESTIGKWSNGLVATLNHLVYINVFGRLLGPYGGAYRNLFNGESGQKKDSPQAKKYIDLDGFGNGRNYDDYLAEAKELAGLYIRAAWRVYGSDQLTDHLRRKFLAVVQSADLSGPLEKDILKTAKDEMAAWSDA